MSSSSSSMEVVKNMYDVALKPRMLRTLIREDLPNENRPLEHPSMLSRVVSTLQTHKLLSESTHPPTDPKLIQRWKSAVDEWVDRVLSLVSTTHMPDKCWAGICLLGVTCQECSSERFLAAYAAWFEKLLSHLQSPTESDFTKVALCASMSDLITRLALFPTTKKEGNSFAGKLIQPLLMLLKEDSSEAIWEGVIHLFCTIITSFPASLHRHYDNVQAAVTAKILSGSFSINLREKLACCLALLPKAKGDGGSWLATMREILLLVNGYLNGIFHGLEEDTKWSEAVRLLVPPGEDPPSIIWGQELLEETSDKANRRQRLCSVSTLLCSCCMMLKNSYSVQVTIPVRSLLALVERVLTVDGSVPRAALPFVIAFEQEFICTELTPLHLHSLDLLSSVMRGMHGQLLPHVAYIVQLIKEYLKRCELPEIRAKVYSIMKTLLISMGVGMAIYLAQEIVDNSFRDLNLIRDDTFHGEMAKASSEAALQPGMPGSKKRKLVSSDTVLEPGLPSSTKRNLGSYETMLQPGLPGLGKGKLGTAGSLGRCQYGVGPEAFAPIISPETCISVKIAALEALEALLTVGGALKSESWRPKVDRLLITIATNSCGGGLANDERNTSFLRGSTSVCAELQLAAFRALLASVLAPSNVRPPYLAQALELFRRGRQEAATRTSEFCSLALLSLEVLIHPRGLPLADFPSATFDNAGNHGFSRTLHSNHQNCSTPFPSSIYKIANDSSDSDDDLYEGHLDSSKETDTPLDSTPKFVDNPNPAEAIGIQQDEKIPAHISLGVTSLGINEQAPTTATADTEMRDNGDEVLAESGQFQEPKLQHQEHELSNDATNPAVAGDPPAQKAELTTIDADAGALHSARQDVLPSELDEFVFHKDAVNAVDSDHDSSGDSIPDIVDVEPDSD